MPVHRSVRGHRWLPDAVNKLGGECVFTSEWDKFSLKTHHAFYGDMPHGDINEVDPESIPDHDILAAGFACQPFSIAGVSKKQSLGQPHGFECERRNLFFKICDIVDVGCPPVLMLENVKTCVRTTRARPRAVIRQELESRDYIVNAEIIDACHWVPQHQRIIMSALTKTCSANRSTSRIPGCLIKDQAKVQRDPRRQAG
ncbi:MAG: DNA (cytosine-5-)-methyltransferase [Phycisphaerales bacterium]